MVQKKEFAVVRELGPEEEKSNRDFLKQMITSMLFILLSRKKINSGKTSKNF